ECVADGTLAKQHFIPDTSTQVLSGHVGMMPVILKLRGSILFGSPPPADVQGVGLVGQCRWLRSRRVKRSIDAKFPSTIGIRQVERIADRDDTGIELVGGLPISRTQALVHFHLC